MESVDEPVADDLPAFEQRIAKALDTAAAAPAPSAANFAGFERVTPTGEGEVGDPYWQVVLRDVNEKLPVSRRQWGNIKGLVS